MGHLAMRQQVLPSLVSQEDSASISLLSSCLSAWENPIIRLISSLFFLSHGRSILLLVLERGIRRHGQE